MKVELRGRILKGANGIYRVPWTIGVGGFARTHDVTLDSPPYDPNSAEPTRVRENAGLSLDGLWAYRGHS